MNYGSGGTLVGKNAEIGEAISQLSKRVNKLERMVGKIGTRQDNADHRQAIKREREDAKQLCKMLILQLKNNNASGNKQVAQKLASQFEAELQNFNRVSQSIEAKEREVKVAISEDSRGRSHDDRDDMREHLLQQDMDSQFVEYDIEEQRRRQEGIRGIEQDVMDVSEMFKDLQDLVNQQQESIDVIENNISGTKDKVESAHDELLTAEKHQNKARKKQCCLLFLVLGIVLAVVLVFAIK